MSTEGGTKAVMAALLANTGIAVTKFVAFLLTGASSMLAESIHSVADSGNQVLLLVGSKRSQRAATREHQFGYGQERYLYSFVVAIVLFSVGGLFALYEAYHKWTELDHAEGGPGVHGEEPASIITSDFWWVAVLVLVIAIVMEGFSFRTAIREAGKVRGSLSWAGFIRRAKAPELPVILLEDFAALLGLVFALAGVGLSLLTQDLVWDVLGTGAIGLLLVAVAFVLAVEMKSLLIGEAATPEAQARIADALESADGVDRVIHLRTLHLGPEQLLVAAKVAVARGETGAEIAASIDAAERAVREAEPTASVIFVEPDVDRGQDPTIDPAIAPA